MENVKMIQDQDQDNDKNHPLLMAFELSSKKWKILFSDHAKRRLISIEAGDLKRLEIEVSKAKNRFGLSQDCQHYSCYEAGRDGFWIHRYLQSRQIENFVVDSSSIEVNRKFRRCKTDKLDAKSLMKILIRYLNGENKAWSVLKVPTVEQEDIRRLNREVSRLTKERISHSNRIQSLLVLHGIRLKIGPNFLKQLENVRQYNDQQLPANMKAEILREYQRIELITRQLKALFDEQLSILQAGSPQAQKALALQKLKGIGHKISWILVFEFFGWRKFKNVKQVGAASGLVPTPYNSGGIKREQGISKAGNQRVRTIMIQLAWLWLRFQPQSYLSQWFKERYANNGSRMRRIGIVALARKLLVALWTYLDKGVVPEGAIVKHQ